MLRRWDWKLGYVRSRCIFPNLRILIWLQENSDLSEEQFTPLKVNEVRDFLDNVNVVFALMSSDL